MPNLVGTGLNQVPTNSMLGGLAYQDPEHASIKDLDLKNLSQINSEISGTAVDIFVYDTRKDSDGGAWRKRTQNTSWYNIPYYEDEYIARGSRKDFPAVAVLVVDSSGLGIYDGDDPDLPLWMKFKTNYRGAIYATPSQGCVAAMNGIIFVGVNTGSNGSFLSEFGFIHDRMRLHQGGSVNQTRETWVYGMVQKSDGSSWLSGQSSISISYGEELIDRKTNDVAVTVLPNAQIDEVSGLPRLTIAVATDSGLSVIKDDGTVVDWTETSGPDSVHKVNFRKDNRLGVFTSGTSGATGYPQLYYIDIPSSDISSGYYYDFNGNNIERYGGTAWETNSDRNLVMKSPSTAPTAHNLTDMVDTPNLTYSATNGGLNAIIRPEAMTSGTSRFDMRTAAIAYIQKDYNTGYMVGDIKGAFLSDTDTSSVGTELITNGTFDSDITGWNTSPYSGSYPGSVTWDSGTIKVSNPYGTNLLCGIKQDLTNLISGKQYVVTFDVTTGTSGGQYIEVAGQDINYSSVGTYSVYFTPNSSSYGLTFGSRRPGYGIATYYDNISVKLAEADRSVSNKGLYVYGTITKSAVATGADLVAYSGFSASNYLKQQYNSDLAPGTGAYSVSCWFKTGTSSGDQYIFDRNDSPSNSSSSRNLLLIMSSGASGNSANKFQWWHRDGSGNVSDIHVTDKTVTDNVWHQVVAVNDGSTYKLYVDGDVSSSTNSTIRNVGNDNDPPMYVGIRHTLGSTYMTGSMALFRYSKSAPSPEQIKKIYNDEKHLFQENAKCTLHGSSDAVTALAYDDTTNLLQVGTSAGRSEFQGLRRINNTTDAVTTAISASNELVAEQ